MTRNRGNAQTRKQEEHKPAPVEFSVPHILEAVRRHLAHRHVVTLATSLRNEPWAATAFYVPWDLDLVVCQGKRARTLAHMLENPRTAFAVDDRKADAWLQGLGKAALVKGDDEARARIELQRVAPEFIRHFSNLEYPVLLIKVDEVTFADRPGGIYPRQHLELRDGEWRIVQ